MKNTYNKLFALLLVCVSCCVINNAYSQPTKLRVAVSANFTPLLNKLKASFEEQSNHQLEIISGATGVLFQQIMHGAPYDVFMAADALRPERLIDEKLADEEFLNTYAIGQLSLWSPHQKVNSLTPLKELRNGALAIANPDIAPYGKAAKETLLALNLWLPAKNQLIRGNNISQTFQQARTGSVQLALVATSQLVANNLVGFQIPNQLHQPIKQKLVLLNSSKQKKAANAFIQFIMSEKIQQRIEQSGYLTEK